MSDQEEIKPVKNTIDRPSLFDLDDDDEQLDDDLSGPDQLSKEELVALLKECQQRLTETYVFKPGDVVRWKPELRNRPNPEYNTPVVVLEVLGKPTFDHEGDSGSPYYKEPLTLVAGHIPCKGRFMIYHFDARRLEPYTP